ncbi:MAG: TonB-dependent receptor [Planctomycetes bacterium]|nr:TonB-dependent receptor [Planctomycetota bacterium]
MTVAPRTLASRHVRLAAHFVCCWALRDAALAQATLPSPQSGAQTNEHKTRTDDSLSTTSRIPEIIVTAPAPEDPRERLRTPLENTAGRDILSPQEVREAGGLNVQQVLRHSPSIFTAEETGSESLPNIAIRGITGNDGPSRSINLAMLADGIPLASAPYGHPGSSLFPIMLERVYAVDVQRGGASVRYGPNNVSGVVNFLTRPIPERLTLDTLMKYDRYHNATVYLGAGDTSGPLGVLLEGVYKDGETYRDHGDYTLQNYALKTSYAFSREFRALVQLESFDDDTDLADGLNKADFEADPFQSKSLQNRFYGNQERANLKLEWQVSPDTRADLISYAYDSERTFELGSPTYYGNNPNYIQSTPRPMRVRAIQPQVTHRYDWGAVDGEFVGGLRYLEEDITRGVERDFPNGTHTLISHDDFEYSTGSAFLENTLLYDEWTVTPGVRVEYVDMAGRSMTGVEKHENFREVLPAVSVSRFVTEDWSVFVNAQTSFAAPQAAQLEVSNDPQDISAQYAYLYEIGTRGEFFDRALAADLTCYLIHYHDRLEQDPAQFDVYVNAGHSRHRGVELTLDGDLADAGVPGLTAWSAISYNESEYRNGQFEGNDLPGAPPLLASWGLRYEFGHSGVWAGIDGYYADDAYSDRANTEQINAAGQVGIRPDFTVWNARLGLDRQVSDDFTFRVLLSARNLFDEEYFEIKSGRGMYLGEPFAYGLEVGLTRQF